jgi:hypothetical protein
MKKTLLILVVCLIALFCFACGIKYYFVKLSRIGSHPIDNLEKLLIDKNDFPQGWKKEYIMPITGDYDWGEKNIMVAFSPKPDLGFAHQYIYHFRNEFASTASYSEIKELLPTVKENSDQFLNFNSDIADEYFIACKVPNSTIRVCDVLSRYDDFIVYFSISSQKDKISPEQLKKVLNSIDQRMAKQIKK